MPLYMNNIVPSTNFINTGTLQRAFEQGSIQELILIPKGKKFTQTEVGSLYATLSAGIIAAADANRFYPIGDFIGMEDKSSEETITTTDVGGFRFGKDGKFHWVFKWYKGGMNYDQMLRKAFHLAQDNYDVLFVDKDANAIVGVKPLANTSSFTLQGFSMDLLYMRMPKINDFTKATEHSFGISLADTDEYIERMAYFVVPQSQPIMGLRGLRNLEFNVDPFPYQVITSSVAKVRLTTDGGAVDLYDTYSAALVALSANFTFSADVGGTTLVCTVSAEAATKTMVFTFSGAAYTALATGAVINCSTPTIAQMTATIPGFANATFQLTK